MKAGRYSWVMLGMGVLVVLGALGLSQFSYPAILPSMQEGLRLSNTQAGAMATANLAGYLCMAPVAGALASWWGLRRVILVGLVAAGAGMIVTGLADGFGLAVAGRIITRVGSAAASVPAHTIPAQWFARERRGLVTGVITLGAALGLVVSGPLVPRLVRAYGESGWRVTWYTLAAATIVIAVAGYLVIRDRPDHKMDKSSNHHADVHLGNWRRVYFLGRIWHLNGIYFAFGFAYMIYATFFTRRLVADIGFSSVSAGNLFMLMGLASLTCGVMWGWILDAVGRRGAITLVLVIQTACYALFALWTDAGGLVFSAVLFGLTAWAIPAIMAAACGDIVGPVLAPLAFGFLTVFHGLGQATGPYVGGRLADALPSFTTAYLVAAGMALLGAIGALLLRQSSRPPGRVESPSPDTTDLL